MEGKELHTDLFQIKSNFFQNPTYIPRALTTAQSSRSILFKKRNWQGCIGSEPAVAVIKNGKNLF